MGVWTEGFPLVFPDLYVKGGLGCPVGSGLSCIT